MRATRAAQFLAAQGPGRVTIVANSYEAAAELTRRALALAPQQAALAWERTTLGLAAATLARVPLSERGLTPISSLAFEALVTRIVSEHRTALARLAPIRDKPGLPRALARTLFELRMSASPMPADADLAALAFSFERALVDSGFIDRAALLTLAAAHATVREPGALVVLDVKVRWHAERELVRALATHATAVFATVPSGDNRSLVLLREALGTEVETALAEGGAIGRLQDGLFGLGAAKPADEQSAVTVLSAPSMNRECVEIARTVLAEADRGTPFDCIAVLLRAAQYGSHLQEAFRRAAIPAFFTAGTRVPDKSGRALLALLACAAEGISARRFAEYLSLGQAPLGVTVAPETVAPETVAPSDELLAGLLGIAPMVAAPEPETDASVPAPRHWQRLLVDASVIGGKERWRKRLAGLRAKLSQDRATYAREDEEARVAAIDRDLLALSGLQKFALPLVDTLAALPLAATWGEWIAALEHLATQALRRPERVLSQLQDLAPMANIAGITLGEVRLVLEPRLTQIFAPPTGRRYGKVWVSTIDDARGMAFDLVCVPGLAEKIFPQKLTEDPLLLDAARVALNADLPTVEQRAQDERLALRLAVGAASKRLVLSYPRIDLEQARPRTPSFYALEVLRVLDGGQLSDFEALAQRAAVQANARLGWPAPQTPEQAIDDAEYDLALLDTILRQPEERVVGEAHYLLNANAHLARALRFRGRRWLPTWRACDGLVDPAPEALAAIREHTFDKRSFSPTALQNYAACPYRFYLSAIHRLEAREEPAPIEDLDPLTRGSLFHEAQFEILTALRAQNFLPLSDENFADARALLDATVTRVAARYHDELAPAIPRVWDDAVASVAADLREWLSRALAEPEWQPAYFELAFGLSDPRPEDAQSRKEPLTLDSGLQVRGSIDLVSRDAQGTLRAVDHKTGKVRAAVGTVVGGGETLQPVLYALALEKRFAHTAVDGGVLYYCTAAADFAEVRVPLDASAREAAAVVARTIGDALESGFFPAAPSKDKCVYCDYRSVCGPYEELRSKNKAQERLRSLAALRDLK